MTRSRNFTDKVGYSEPESFLYGAFLGLLVVGGGALGLVLS